MNIENLLDVKGALYARSVPALGSPSSQVLIIDSDQVKKRTPAQIIADGGGSFLGHTHDWTDIVSGKPTTLSGYGITDAVSSSRTLTIQGTTNQISVSPTAQDLSANRTWTLSLPQDIHSGASPTFNGMSLIGTGSVLAIRGTGTGIYGSLRFGTTTSGFTNWWAGIESSGNSIGLDVADLRFYTTFGTRSQKFQIHYDNRIGVEPSSRIGAGNGYGTNTTATAQAYLELYNGTDGNTRLINTGAFSIILGTNNTERMRITSAGNVLIGTTDDSDFFRLNVATNVNGDLARFMWTGGSKNPFTANIVANDSLVYVAAGNSDNTASLGFLVNSTERMRIVSSGNVLISTTTDNAVDRLQVNGSGSFADQISASSRFAVYTIDGLFSADARPNKFNTPSGGDRVLIGYLDQGGGQYWGRIGFAGSTNWSLGTGAGGHTFTIGRNNFPDAIDLSVDNAGKVTVHNGVFQINKDISNVSLIQTNSDNSALVLVASSSLVDHKPRIEMTGTTYSSPSNHIFYRAGTHVFTSSTASTEYGRITSGGNLLLGVASDVASGFGSDYRFVVHSANQYNTALFRSSSHAMVQIESTSAANQAIMRFFSPTKGWGMGLNTDGRFFIGDETAPATRLSITTGGNVLVGTTTDNVVDRVQVNGSVSIINAGVDGVFADAYVSRLNLNTNESNAIQTTVSSSASLSGYRIQVSNGGGSSARTTVADFLRDRQIFYGNVLIGTTTDNTVDRLQVNGSVVATSYEVGNGQYYKARRTTGNLLIDLLGIEAGTDNTRLLITGDFNITNGALTKLVTVNTAGNVGIGTTSPNTRLEVMGVSEGEYFRGGAGTLSERSLRLSNFTNGGFAGVGHFIDAPHSSGIVAIGANSSSRLYVTSTSVGINTTTPQWSFEAAITNNTGIMVGGTSTTAGTTYGLHLGYFEQNNTAYRKTALIHEQIGDAAARGNLHIAVNAVSNAASATLSDTRMVFYGLTGNILINPITSTTFNGVILHDAPTGAGTETSGMFLNGSNQVVRRTLGSMAFASTSDYYLASNPAGYTSNLGTVTSVSLSLPAIFDVTGSPVTTSGTLTATLISQSAKTVLAAPSGSAGNPSFRQLTLNDLVSVNVGTPTFGQVLRYIGGPDQWQNSFLNAGDIAGGILPVQRGGTGSDTFFEGVVFANGTTPMTALTGSPNTVLRRNPAGVYGFGTIGDAYISGLDWSKLSNVPSSFTPSANSGFYIQNQALAPQTANAWINGTLTVGEVLVNLDTVGTSVGDLRFTPAVGGSTVITRGDLYYNPPAGSTQLDALFETPTTGRIVKRTLGSMAFETASNYVPTTRQILTQHSLTGGGDLTASRTLNLVNDVASPGNNKVYGTDGAGVRGWFDASLSVTDMYAYWTLDTANATGDLDTPLVATSNYGFSGNTGWNDLVFDVSVQNTGSRFNGETLTVNPGECWIITVAVEVFYASINGLSQYQPIIGSSPLYDMNIDLGLFEGSVCIAKQTIDSYYLRFNTYATYEEQSVYANTEVTIEYVNRVGTAQAIKPRVRGYIGEDYGINPAVGATRFTAKRIR